MGHKKKIKRADPWPGVVAPQLAFLVAAPPEGERWIHEIKFDGYRLQAQIQKSTIKLFSRGSLNWSERFPTLQKALEQLDVRSAILDGEAVVIDKAGRSNFSSLQNALAQKDYSSMRFYLFDLLYLNGEDLRNRPLLERKKLLKSILPKNDSILFYSEEIQGSGAKFFKKCCQYKLEGIVSKDREAPYTSGRSRIWCKTKCTRHQEFLIGGYSAGKGERQNVMGALLLGDYQSIGGEKKFRYVGRVGTGFDQQTLEQLTKKMLKLGQKKSPFDLHSPKGKDLHWVRPELVAEVNFSEWTKDQILRTPVYLGLSNSPQSVELSHPEKILFPVEKISKQMIAEYYQRVSRWMFPYLLDRPLSLVRCPNGADKKCFYQKHPAAGMTSAYFKSFEVLEKSTPNLNLALTSAAGLEELIQMNAFEIHCWNVQYQSLMHPDQFVLDFDPGPGTSFKQVVEGCLEMKKILDLLKLKSFVKVTGGKGVHIHVPIEPLYSWDQVKSFSKALAEELVSRQPKLFTSNMSKQKRKGKIFIDYFRNTYGATSVAPYSLRAKKISAVALPLEWNELSKLHSADQFTLKKALQKMSTRKSDPWSKFKRIKQKIKLLE